MAYVLALAAALVAATAAVLQRVALESAPDDAAMKLRLMTHALRHATWIAGFALLLAQFGLQASALRFGPLSVVQPVLTTELLFLVGILAFWFRRALSWREWAAVGAVVAGLAGFFAIAAPARGVGSPSRGAWIIATLATVAVTSGFIAAARRGPRWWRAVAFGVGGAVLFAYNAALTKALTTLITQGWGHVFVSWVPYALAVTGLGSLFLLQNALHAGPITAARAASVIVNPLVSILLGVTMFAEHLRSGALAVPGEIAALAVLCSGAVALTLSPLVAGATSTGEAGEFLGSRPPVAVADPASDAAT